MSDVKVKCPHCGNTELVETDFDEGYDKSVIEGLECSKCEALFGCELVSENIYCESTWKHGE